MFPLPEDELILGRVGSRYLLEEEGMHAVVHRSSLGSGVSTSVIVQFHRRSVGVNGKRRMGYRYPVYSIKHTSASAPVGNSWGVRAAVA